MALKPITRQEQIIAGKNLEPITRMERFLKEYGGGSGGGGGGGSGGDVWEEILDITLSEDTSTVILSQDKNGNAFSLNKVFFKFIPAYNSEKKTSKYFRAECEAGYMDVGLDETRTQSVLVYIDEVQAILSTHYDDTTGSFDTYAIETQQVSRNNMTAPITEFRMEYPNVTYYAGTKITVWGVRV